MVKEPSVLTGLVATAGIDAACEMGLFRLGGGLLLLVIFRWQVREADEDDDWEEMLWGCLLNMLDFVKE